MPSIFTISIASFLALNIFTSPHCSTPSFWMISRIRRSWGLISTFCSACVSFPSLLTHLRPLGRLAVSVLSLKGKFGFLRLLRPILTFLLTFLAIFRSVPMLRVFVCTVNLSACFLSRSLRLYHVLESIGEFDDFWFFEVMLASSQPFLHQFDRSACA